MSVERTRCITFVFIWCSLAVVCHGANDKKLKLRQQHHLEPAQAALRHSDHHTVGVFDSRGLQHLRRESNITAPGQLSDESILPTSHPPWLQKCRSIYLDVGSNIGVQVRKFYEPERYPNASVLSLFDEIFGSAANRKTPAEESGMCALGLEANPSHYKHLQELEDAYRSKGWHVHFYPVAAWISAKKLAFYQVPDPAHEDWAAHLGTSANKTTIEVDAVDLGAFVASLPIHAVKLMKMDIEGAEYETILHMVDEKMLCQGIIDKAFIEAHKWQTREPSVSSWKANLTYPELFKVVNAADCSGKGPTELLSMDDESYIHDDPEYELKDHVDEDIGHSYLTLVLIGCVVLTLLASGFVSLQSYCRPRKDKPWHAKSVR